MHTNIRTNLMVCQLMAQSALWLTINAWLVIRNGRYLHSPYALSPSPTVATVVALHTKIGQKCKSSSNHSKTMDKTYFLKIIWSKMELKRKLSYSQTDYNKKGVKIEKYTDRSWTSESNYLIVEKKNIREIIFKHILLIFNRLWTTVSRCPLIRA